MPKETKTKVMTSARNISAKAPKTKAVLSVSKTEKPARPARKASTASTGATTRAVKGKGVESSAPAIVKLEVSQTPRKPRKRKDVTAAGEPEVKKESKAQQVGADKAGAPRAESEGGEEHFARWTGKSFVRRPWEINFYRICLAASVAVILWSLLDGSWLQAVTFASLFFILILEIRDQPKDVEYEINIDGIVIDGKLYRFEDIRSFAFEKKSGSDIIRLQVKNALFPLREVHLAADQDILFIEALLEYFLPKEAHEDTLFDFRRVEEEGEELTDEEFINKKVDEYLKGRF